MAEQLSALSNITATSHPIGVLDLCQPVSPFWVDVFNTTWPDFTICFEDTILITAPYMVLALYCLFYLPYLYGKSKRVKLLKIGPTPVLFNVKLGLCATMITLHLVELGLTGLESTQIQIPGSYILSSSISLCGMMLVALLVVLERRAGVRSSGILCVFWILNTLVLIFKCRTIIHHSIEIDNFWPSPSRLIIFAINMCLVITSTILSFFADLSKVLPNKKDKNLSPEYNASFLSKITFWWMNRMMWMGFRRPLTDRDLWQLDDEDKCYNLGLHFNEYWQQEVEQKKTKDIHVDGITIRSSKPSIFIALAKAFGRTFLFAGILRFLETLILFTTPQLLRLFIEFMSDKSVDSWFGYILAIGLFLVTIISALFREQYQRKCFICGIKIRSSLVWAIYRKALLLSDAARKDSTVGEIVNLMSYDAQQFQSLIMFLHDIWSSPLQIGICVYFLYNTLGAASLAGVGILLVLLPINIILCLKARNIQVKQLKLKDERIQVISEVVNAIKTLKMCAWEEPFLNIINEIRDNELKLLRTSSILYGVAEIAWQASPLLVSLVTFATYILSGNSLTVESAFVGMSLFNLLRFPVGILPIVLSNIMQLSISLKRITSYMLRNELESQSICRQMPPGKETIAVNFNKASFKWSPTDDKPVLNRIQLEIPKGSLVAIVGHVGSGKSSLLNSIIGELHRSHGDAFVEGSISYVPQQPWIENCSFKDNVLFGNEYDTARYRQTLQACSLYHDLRLLPGADLTEIGEKGLNLSGGQKQRLNLARAVYCNRDIYLLDNTLSAVDINVGTAIFNCVIGPNGTLRHKTRILVTHNLSFLPQMDQIYVMNKGLIVERGTYKTLIADGGAFSEVLQTFTKTDETPNKYEKELDQDNDDNQENIKLNRQVSTISTVSSPVPNPKNRTGVIRIKSKSKDSFKKQLKREIKKKKITSNEEAMSGQVKVSVYLLYMKSIGFFLGIIIVLFEIAGQACYAVSSFWLVTWTSNLNNTNATQSDEYYLGIYGLIAAIQIVVLGVNAIVIALARIKASDDFHFNLVHSVVNAPISFFDSTPIGRIINRFSHDINGIDEVVPTMFSGFLSMSVSALMVIVVVSVSTPTFIIAIVPLFIMYFFTQRFYISTSRQLGRLESISRSPIFSHFSESLQGVATIRSFGVQERFATECHKKVDVNQMAYYPSAATNFWLGVHLDFIGACIVLLASTLAVYYRGSILAGSAAVSVSFALQITNVLNWMVRAANGLEKSIIAAERIKEYSDISEQASAIIDDSRPPPGWPSKGEIEFESYSVSYNKNSRLVLRNINVKVEAREKLGVIGRTGAGKTTLVRALFRLSEPCEGCIYIDGLNISKIGLYDLRSKLTIIPQDPVLFTGSLRLNIDPSNQYSDSEIWNALESVHLKSFVYRLDKGLYLPINEGGENLSVGQRQLICLARAMLQNSKILVLDEATASIDTESDQLVQKTIREQFKASTVITIAHRLNTVLDSSRILILENGIIKEHDRPSNLIANNSSKYYHMLKDADLLQN